VVRVFKGADKSMDETNENPETPAAEAASAAPIAGEGVRMREPKIPLPSSLQEIVGALLFASPSPLSAQELRTCVQGVEPAEGDDAEVMGIYKSCTSREIDEALHGLEKELERAHVGFRLVCTGGTYRLQTAPTCGRYVRALLKLDRPARLTRAALETLAIVAYRQPITKTEVEQIRGVAVDTIMKTLVDLQLVRLVGKSELPGHPFLYGTTPLFLEHFGLASLDQLNEIDPTLPRSNPRQRAAQYKKPDKPEEPTLAEAAAEEGGKPEGEKAEEAELEKAEASKGEMVEGQEDAKVEALDDDDVFIDDTPDEFDDEDEDDEDDEDGEEDGDEDVDAGDAGDDADDGV